MGTKSGGDDPPGVSSRDSLIVSLPDSFLFMCSLTITDKRIREHIPLPLRKWNLFVSTGDKFRDKS